jgi:DNA-binding response OmpR family regulator
MDGDTPVVLVAEDERDLADFFALSLRDDYEVRLARDGTSAVEAFDADVDVALLDRRMPGKAGDEVLDHIRDAETDCAVAMVTAVDPDLDIVEMGFDDYINKPVSKDELRSLVASMVRRVECDDALRRHYRLARKVALLEAEKSAGVLAESDEYAHLLDELAAVDRDLAAPAAEMSAEDVGSLLRTDGSSE